MKFYEIDEQLRSILDNLVIDEETGEFIDSEGVFDQIRELVIERDSKLEGLGIYIKELTAEAEALKVESKNLRERSERKIKKADKLKEWVSSYMLRNEIKSIETSKIKLSFRKSEVVDADETKVPKKYFNKKVEFVLDKMGIKKLLKSGTKIKGCQLIEKQNLQVK